MLFFFTLRLLCLSSYGRIRDHRHRVGIALLSAVLWASHPIQVTAVTYIVQRMTALAGLFSLLAMYSFLKARTAEGIWYTQLLTWHLEMREMIVERTIDCVETKTDVRKAH